MTAVNTTTIAKQRQTRKLLLLAEFCRAAERERIGLKTVQQNRAPEVYLLWKEHTKG